MAWEEELFGFLDELEQQAEALYDAERAPELADRSRAEYQQVPLAARLMATVGDPVTLQVRGVGAVRGDLARVATGWCLVAQPAQDWVVRLDAVDAVEGASSRATPEVAWPVTARLTVASALRRLAGAGERCVVHLVDGARHEGVPRRVGQDFVELVVGGEGHERVVLLAFAAVAAVQSDEAG